MSNSAHVLPAWLQTDVYNYVQKMCHRDISSPKYFQSWTACTSSSDWLCFCPVSRVTLMYSSSLFHNYVLITLNIWFSYLRERDHFNTSHHFQRSVLYVIGIVMAFLTLLCCAKVLRHPSDVFFKVLLRNGSPGFLKVFSVATGYVFTHFQCF